MNNALNTINGYRQNSIIMEFVINEATSKVAAEFGINPSEVGEAHAGKVAAYVAAGLVGCYLASLG